MQQYQQVRRQQMVRARNTCTGAYNYSSRISIEGTAAAAAAAVADAVPV